MWFLRVLLKVPRVLRRRLSQSINEVYMSVCWLISSLLLLLGQNLRTVHNERYRQKLNSPFFYMYFPTAILLQDVVYMYTNFSERNSDAWISTSVSEQEKMFQTRPDTLTRQQNKNFLKFLSQNPNHFTSLFSFSHIRLVSNTWCTVKEKNLEIMADPKVNFFIFKTQNRNRKNFS